MLDNVADWLADLAAFGVDVAPSENEDPEAYCQRVLPYVKGLDLSAAAGRSTLAAQWPCLFSAFPRCRRILGIFS